MKSDFFCFLLNDAFLLFPCDLCVSPAIQTTPRADTYHVVTYIV